MNIFLSPFAPETVVSRDGFDRSVPRHPAHSPHSRLNLALTHGILPDFRAASIYLFKPPYAIGPVPSLLVHATAYRWRSLARVRRHRASSPQGSSSNGCCLCITMDQLMCASLFPQPLLVCSGHLESIGSFFFCFLFGTKHSRYLKSVLLIPGINNALFIILLQHRFCRL